MQGRHHTEASIAKIIANQPNRKAIRVTEISSGRYDDYPSQNAAARALHINESVVRLHLSKGTLHQNKYSIVRIAAG